MLFFFFFSFQYSFLTIDPSLRDHAVILDMWRCATMSLRIRVGLRYGTPQNIKFEKHQYPGIDRFRTLKRTHRP